MRLKLGRPDIGKYAGRFDVPPASGGLGVTFLGVTSLLLDDVVPVHTHYDHALDSAVVAEMTDALLVGGESAANIGRGHGLPEERIRVATPNEPMTYGAFTITVVESHHCPPDRSPGTIDEPVVPP